MSHTVIKLTLLGPIIALSLALAGCGSPPQDGVYKLGRPYQIAGRWYYPEFDSSYDRVGVASWYGVQFHGRATANGERFDRDALSAAHPTLPLPSIVRVTNLTNHRQLELRVNDRGPFVGDRLIDLSQAAARELGYEREGVTQVRVEFVGLADAKGVAPRPGVSPAPRELAPPAPPEPPPLAAEVVLVAAPARQCEGRFIQVGAFAEPARAWQAAARLYGLAAAPVSAERLTGDRLLRVRLGPIADPRSAAATLDQLKHSGYAGAFIVGDQAGMATPC